MELVKLLAVFCIIILVMWLKRPLMAAIVAACVGTVVLYQLPLDVAWGALVKGATNGGGHSEEHPGISPLQMRRISEAGALLYHRT